MRAGRRRMRNERRRGTHRSAYTPYDVHGCNDPQRIVAACDEPGRGCGPGGENAQAVVMGDRRCRCGDGSGGSGARMQASHAGARAVGGGVSV
eukprot:6212029-Pleurochrysis_carterae.AAC.2